MNNLTTSGKFPIIIFLMIILLIGCLGKTEKETKERDEKYNEKKKVLEYKDKCGKIHVHCYNAKYGIKCNIDNCERDSCDSYPLLLKKYIPILKVETDSNGVRRLHQYDSTEKKLKPIQLRGMSSHGLQWIGRASITKHNIKALKEDWKCNLFRIAVHVNEEGGYFCNPGRTHRLLDSTVVWCEEAGIYCLIDLYVSRPGNPNDFTYRHYKMDTIIFSKELHKAGEKSSPNKTIDLAGSFFTYCAKRYKDKTNVIYGLCAQPNGVDFNESQWANYYDPVVTWQYHIRPYCEDMIKIIRDIDPTKVIICGTPHFSTRPQDVIGNEPQNNSTGEKYDNLMYMLQICAGSNLSEFNKDRLEVSKILEKIPIFVIPFMTTDFSDLSNFNQKESEKWLNFFYNKKISWCNWSFASKGDKSDEYCALKWNSGRIPNGDSILTESGKYIRRKLREFDSKTEK